MSAKTFAIYQFSKLVRRRVKRDSLNAVADQEKIKKHLVTRAQKTQFGLDHNFDKIKNYSDFKKSIPLRDYEELKSYIQSIKEGKEDILYPGRPKYFAKTSGTTSGVKYIPLTVDSMPNHMNTARNALLNYTASKKDASIFGGKLIFLSGSPTLYKVSKIDTGRLSGIVNHEIPKWVKANQLPSYSSNCIEDWETKLDKIVDETIDQDMTLISGIPPWVKMYFDRLIERSGKSTILEIFPNLKLFAHGGVNFQPYAASIYNLIGEKIDTLETYPASEGFIAFQDSLNEEGLLLNTNSGIFFEFVEASKYFDKNPPRIELSAVELGVDYAVIINNNAGLWGYKIGDTVQFISKDPYRLIVSGRVSHFISAFGEHVIAKEVEQALNFASSKLRFEVVEFTVAPQVNPQLGLPYHEWFIAFKNIPNDLDQLAKLLNQSLCQQNIYYRDLIDGAILQSLKITPLPANAFQTYMKKIGKLGGQNKVPRLSNDRNIVKNL